LRGARFSEIVEGTDADEGFHLFRKRLDTQEEIGKRRKYGALALVEDGFFGTDGQALKLQDGDTDGRRKAEIRRSKSERRPKLEIRSSTLIFSSR